MASSTSTPQHPCPLCATAGVLQPPLLKDSETFTCPKCGFLWTATGDYSDLLPARLARMKILIDRIERGEAQSTDDQRERLKRLRVELDVARRDIKLFKT